MNRIQQPLAGVLIGLLSAALPAHAGVETEERAAVAALLRERGQTSISSVLGQSESGEESAIRRLLERPLTVDAALRLALLNHRGVRASLAALGIPRGQLTQASLPPNPEVEVSLRVPHDAAQPLQAELGVDYDIAALILIPLRRGVAKTDLLAARQRAAKEVLEVAALRARLSVYAFPLFPARRAATDRARKRKPALT